MRRDERYLFVEYRNFCAIIREKRERGYLAIGFPFFLVCVKYRSFSIACFQRGAETQQRDRTRTSDILELFRAPITFDTANITPASSMYSPQAITRHRTASRDILVECVFHFLFFAKDATERRRNARRLCLCLSY